MFNVSLPMFRENAYLEQNPDVRAGIASGDVPDAVTHFLEYGIDETRNPRMTREALALAGSVDRCLVSESGFIAVIGWLGDEGFEAGKWTLFGSDFSVEISPTNIFRHARFDVEKGYRDGPYDYGFLALGRTASKSLLRQPLLFQFQSNSGEVQIRTATESVSDKRLLDVCMIHLTASQSHAGLEVGLNHFVRGEAGAALTSLFERHVKRHVGSPYVETFGRRPVERSFVTVLFGTTEPMMVQPMLFKSMGVDFGEWIYVINSAEDAGSALRLGRLISELYDLCITVVIMTDNVGFGAANNVGISFARSDNIYVINPDVFPLDSEVAYLSQFLARPNLTDVLWGGLLFYDEYNLMHSGMYIERDIFVRSTTYQRLASDRDESHVALLRVEHFGKGVPFNKKHWTRPIAAPAISGAVMAFDRGCFERLNGFSTRYIYGHYEDADLSLRWNEKYGSVQVDPKLALVHLEGQGSRPRGGQYRAAQLLNRYFFSQRHNSLAWDLVSQASRSPI